MPDELYIRIKIGREIYGPYKRDFIEDLIKKGKIAGSNEVSSNKTNWYKIADMFPYLFDMKETIVFNKKDVKNIFGNYEIVEKIGEGGMAIVYKANDLKSNKTYALKILHDSEQVDSESVKRFIREAQSMAKLNHPNIISVKEVGFKPKYFLSMEYIEGSTLEDLIKSKKLSKKKNLKIFLEILQAVDHAHKNGIIHRDLKPSNIMITEDLKPKVMDFGLAKNMEIDKSLSQTGKFLGTPKYISPEQAHTNSVDKRTDIYSLGVILYEMLTGRAPLEAESAIQILSKLANENPLPPSNFNNTIKGDLDTICLKCLKKSPNDRYQSIKFLEKEIERVLENKPIKTRNMQKIKKDNKVKSYKFANVIFIILLSFFLSLVFYFVNSKIINKNKNDDNKLIVDKELIENQLKEAYNLCKMGGKR